MNYLLDTPIALWAIAGSTKLPLRILDILDDNNNSIYISIASVWEIAIKNYIKPEQIPMNEKDFIRFCEKLSYAKLSIKLSHIYELRNLKRKNTIVKFMFMDSINF